MSILVRTFIFDLQKPEGLEDRISEAFNDCLAMDYGVAHSFLTEKQLILVFAPKQGPPRQVTAVPGMVFPPGFRG